MRIVVHAKFVRSTLQSQSRLAFGHRRRNKKPSTCSWLAHSKCYAHFNCFKAIWSVVWLMCALASRWFDQKSTSRARSRVCTWPKHEYSWAMVSVTFICKVASDACWSYKNNLNRINVIAACGQGWDMVGWEKQQIVDGRERGHVTCWTWNVLFLLRCICL